jgi:hypothetical protein
MEARFFFGCAPRADVRTNARIRRTKSTWHALKSPVGCTVSSRQTPLNFSNDRPVVTSTLNQVTIRIPPQTLRATAGRDDLCAGGLRKRALLCHIEIGAKIQNTRFFRMRSFLAYLSERCKWASKGTGAVCGWVSLIIGAALAVLL